MSLPESVHVCGIVSQALLLSDSHYKILRDPETRLKPNFNLCFFVDAKHQ